MQALPEEDWRQEIAKQAQNAIGQVLWGKIWEQWRIKNSLCTPLAEAARDLLKIAATAEDADEALAAKSMPPLLRDIANALVNGSGLHPFAPLAVKLRSTAHALRILGIFSCSVLGCLPNCQCLKDLAADLAGERIRGALWNFLPTNYMGLDNQAG